MSEILYPDSCFTNDSVRSELELAVVKPKKWENGKLLRVQFLEGTDEQTDKFEEWADQWTQFANVRFEFGSQADDAELRVTFRPNLGNWSAVGTDSLLDVFKNEPPFSTINIGQLTRRVVLHEVGHAIGCIHEHQSPASDIDWNRDVVRRELSQPPNSWDDVTIEHNIFRLQEAGITQFSELDPTSIMMYPIPARWTNDGFSTSFNDELSNTDKSFIAELYPSGTDPVQKGGKD